MPGRLLGGGWRVGGGGLPCVGLKVEKFKSRKLGILQRMEEKKVLDMHDSRGILERLHHAGKNQRGKKDLDN